MRNVNIDRKTSETDITLSLELDGSAKALINTGNRFFDHMLELFATHGCFDIELSCRAENCPDFHHTAEDTGIVLGQAFRQALGDRAGIRRYGSLMLPMDESLIAAAVDLDGRGTLNFDVALKSARVGDFDTELVREFFLAFVRQASVTVHLIRMSGENTHHLIEAVFKSFARALSAACEMDPRSDGSVPSSKGTLL